MAYDYECPVGQDGPLPCGFVSRGWPTKKAAAERGAQHQAEHDSGEPMPELAESGISGAVN